MNSSIFYPGWAIRPEYYQTYATDSCVDYGFFSQPSETTTPISENLPQANIVFAHSMGCINAIKMAASGKTGALVLFSPFISFCDGQTPETVDAMIKQLALSPARLLKSFYRTAMSPEKTSLDSGTTLNAEKLEEGLLYLKNSSLCDSLKSIRIPVLILAGTADLIVPLKSSEQTASHIASSELKLFEGAGHMLPLTRSRDCQVLIKEFLGKVAL